MLDARGLGVSLAGLVGVAHTARELVGEPLVGKGLELAAAVVVSAQASCSMVSGPGRLLNGCLVADRRSQWRGVHSVEYEDDCNLGTQV